MNDLLISGEIPWFSMKKIRVETHLWLTPKWFWNNLDRSHSTQEGMNKIWYTVDVYCWLGMKDLTVVRWIHYLNQRVITGIVTCLIHLKPQLIGTYRKIYGIIADLRSADHDTVRILASLPSHPHRWRFVIYLVPPNTNVGNLSPSRTATAMHKCIKCMLTKNCHSDDPNSRQGVHVTSFYNCWD